LEPATDFLDANDSQINQDKNYRGARKYSYCECQQDRLNRLVSQLRRLYVHGNSGLGSAYLHPNNAVYLSAS
jgi:hypothetical protein